MKKGFVKLNNALTPKNKLSKDIILELKHFDQVLFPSVKIAEKEVNRTFMEVVQNYLKKGGKAHLPDIINYDLRKGRGICVQGVVTLLIYEVCLEVPDKIPKF